MSTLHIYRGLPGSGKTYHAKDLVSWLSRKGINSVRIERDDIRMELLGSYWTGIHEDEQKVTKAQHERIKGALKLGFDVISSDTNLVDRNVREMLKFAHETGSDVVWYDLRDESLDDCIQRDASRERTVGEDVIRDKYNRFIKGRKLDVQPVYEPKVDTSKKTNLDPIDFEAVEKYVPPETGYLKTILLDIDGTVANHEGVRSPYDFTKYRDDTVHEDVVDVILALKQAGYKIAVFSGRHVKYRDDLVWWLDHHGIPHDRLIMRERDGMRDDYEKLYLFEKYMRNDPTTIVHSVFDDRNRVVQNTWRTALGLRCFQVANGDF